QQSFLIVMGHLGNWEWGGGAVAQRFNIKTCVIYHPLEHPLFDRLFYRIRARMGGIPVPMQSVYKEMVKRKNELTATVFLGDQNPLNVGAIWTEFLHQPTAVFR